VIERLLLVEQNHLFREGLALLLEWETGLSSVCAGSLIEARCVLEDANHKPDCVIVDLDLPDGEGTELLTQLNGLPAVALINGESLERKAEVIGLGADEVVSVKGPPEEIIAAVERLIGPTSE
jgi:DNA-binding NarL/FixJ family response regulator